ncbi:Holliday junction branch migration protein RuvA, partial [Patescibacteria group bacterium]|nr:Holliday junction branch migration protein RuvA [Patescibacteria group bacterium]
MISYLKGTIKEKDNSFIVLENQGIGFKVFVSEKNLKEIKIDEQKEFFIFFAMRNEK